MQSDDEYSGEGSHLSPMNGLAQSMLDRTRMALCMFMLAIFAFNPFGKLFSQAASAFQSEERQPSVGRAILEDGKRLLRYSACNDRTNLLPFISQVINSRAKDGPHL